MSAAIYRTCIRHVRRTPLHNAFTYRSYSWYVDVDELPTAPPAPAAGRIPGEDHLGDPDGSMRGNVERFLARDGDKPDGGRITMLASARVFGHVFNPLSLFWCHDADGRVRCVIAEVHNTYGERHCYLLETGRAPDAPRPEGVLRLAVQRRRRPVPDEAARTRRNGSPSRSSWSGTGRSPSSPPWTGDRRPGHRAEHPGRGARGPAGAAPRSALQIRWQGIKLWARRLPIIKRPTPPLTGGSLSDHDRCRQTRIRRTRDPPHRGPFTPDNTRRLPGATGAGRVDAAGVARRRHGPSGSRPQVAGKAAGRSSGPPSAGCRCEVRTPTGRCWAPAVARRARS